MMRSRLLLVLSFAPWLVTAQTLTITSPTSGQSVTGFSFTLSSTCSSCPSLNRVVYFTDGEIGGTATQAPWSVQWDPWNFQNGPHNVTATAYDAAGSVIATASEVDFTTANTGGVYGSLTPAFTVSPSTAWSSNWSGVVTLTITTSGTLPSGGLGTAQISVDGIVINQNASLASGTYQIDTRAFNNGTHKVGWRILAASAMYTVSCSGIPSGTCSTFDAASLSDWGEGAHLATFANSNAAMEVRASAYEVRLAIGGTYTATCNLINDDESVASSTTCQYYSQSPAVATVNQNSGLITGVAYFNDGGLWGSNYPAGEAIVRATAITFTSATGDLTIDTPSYLVTSASYTFSGRDQGNVLWITGGTGCTVGAYEIGHIDTSTYVSISPTPGTTGSHCTWQTGPSENIYVEVRANPSAYVPHFNLSNGINTGGWVSGSSVFGAEMFNNVNASQGLNDYNWPTFCTDYYKNAGFNGYETQIWPSPGGGTVYTGYPSVPGWPGLGTGATQSAWTSAISTLVSSTTSAFSSCPGLLAHGQGLPSIQSNSGELYPPIYGPGASFTTPILTDAYQRWASSGLPFLGTSNGDEVPFTNTTLTSVIFGNYGLSSITCNGTTCTVAWPYYAQMMPFAYSANFMITGATTNTCLNVSSPNVYQYSTLTPGTGFTFANTACGSITANATSDPSLTIDRFSLCWIDPSTGNTEGTGGSSTCSSGSGSYTARVLNNAYLQYATMATAGTGTLMMGWPVLGAGTSAQNIIGLLQSPFGQYWDGYISGAAGYGATPYLTTVSSINSIKQQIGLTYRQSLQAVPDTMPWSMDNASTPSNYGFEGYTSINGNGTTLTLASCSGNTLTTTTPHGLSNILAQIASVVVSGSTGSLCDGQYYVEASPTATTLTVTLAIPNFTASTSSPYGTITFQDGSTFAASHLYTPGGINTYFLALTTPCPSTGAQLPSKVGQTFTVSGATPSNSPFNYSTDGYVFMYTRDSFLQCSGTTASGTAFFRQLPSLSGPSGGGTVQIRADLSNIRGRNYDLDYDVDDYTSFAEANYCILLGCAMIRAYQMSPNLNAWSPTQGVAGRALGNTFLVQDLGDASFQLGMGTSNIEMNPLNPNATSKGKMYAVGNVAKMATRLGPYLMGQRLASPDYGNCCEASARSSASGKILMLMNMTNQSLTRTITLTPYETSGQAIALYVVTARTIQVSTIAAGTSTYSLTVPNAATAFFVFPTTFAGFLSQPTMSVRLADITNATDVAIRYGYDPYNLDVGDIAYDCGTGAACLLPVDHNIGPIFYRIIYRNSSAAVLATSDIQKF